MSSLRSSKPSVQRGRSLIRWRGVPSSGRGSRHPRLPRRRRESIAWCREQRGDATCGEVFEFLLEETEYAAADIRLLCGEAFDAATGP